MKQQQHQTKPDRGKPFDLRMPPDLHLQLKLEAVRQGITMNAFILEAIREKIEREAK